MSFLNAITEDIESAAKQLEAIGAGISTQSAAAAAPTTSVAPAGSDPVSALQSAVFSAYGSLYQKISAEAQAIHQQFVQTLSQSGMSYSTAESSNAATATNPFTTVMTLLNSNTTGIGYTGFGNFAAGSSDLLGLASGQLLPAAVATTSDTGDLGGLGAALAGDTAPMGVGGSGGAPVLAGASQASSVGGLSVPPTWAGATVSAEPVKLVSANWAGPVPQTAPMSTVPAGIPAGASPGRSAGLGAPRYGVKPTVMPKSPKPAIV
ncbi:PE domain-containing protein [Mycobacterium sp.]|uniref:PPE family protein, SVP subgroup n=1 Tax=Mycobacterium sp. TaxID=1785 RepID=UPI0031E1302A